MSLLIEEFSFLRDRSMGVKLLSKISWPMKSPFGWSEKFCYYSLLFIKF